MDKDIKEIRLQSIEGDHPETISQQRVLIEPKIPVNMPSITQSIIQLEQEEKIKPNETNLTPQASLNLRSFLKKNSNDYWITVVLTLVSVITVFIFQDAAQSYLRYSMGLLLALCLPGYSLVRALFPPKTLQFEKQSSLDWLLTAAFSIVLSIVLVSVVGLVLDFSPWGLDLKSLTLSLSSLTFLFATVAMLRRYRTKKLVH